MRPPGGVARRKPEAPAGQAGSCSAARKTISLGSVAGPSRRHEAVSAVLAAARGIARGTSNAVAGTKRHRPGGVALDGLGAFGKARRPDAAPAGTDRHRR